jgi:hypothetical protein
VEEVEALGLWQDTQAFSHHESSQRHKMTHSSSSWKQLKLVKSNFAYLNAVWEAFVPDWRSYGCFTSAFLKVKLWNCLLYGTAICVLILSKHDTRAACIRLSVLCCGLFLSGAVTKNVTSCRMERHEIWRFLLCVIWQPFYGSPTASKMAALWFVFVGLGHTGV